MVSIQYSIDSAIQNENDWGVLIKYLKTIIFILFRKLVVHWIVEI